MVTRRRRDIWDVVVAGGGIAGLTAAWLAARRGLAVALLEPQGMYGGQVGTVNTLDDWPAAGVASGVDLATSLVEKLHAESVEILTEAASGVAQGDGLLLVKAGEQSLRVRRLVAATGARLRTLGVPGEETLRGKGVSQCAHCDGGFFKDQDVVVVGGGDAALQEALVLADSSRAVSIVVRAGLRARRAYADRASAKPNISFVWDATVEAIEGDKAVTGVRVRAKNGEQKTLACSGVFPFVGVEPNVEWLPASVRRDGAGRVATDERCRTSDAAIFAIGALRAGYAGDLTNAAGEASTAVAAIAADLAA
jgi:thioredoxin reductase (NADPH)